MKKFYFTLVTFLFLVVANAQIVNIPDIAFKNRLLQASSNNQIASIQTPNSSGSVTTYNSIDTNNDGEIQISEAIEIKYLNVGYSLANPGNISDVEGINSFANLESFSCSYNQLSSLNINGLTNLKKLKCIKNLITNLNLIGLVGLDDLDCSYNQLSNLNVSILPNLERLNSSYNQLSSINFNGLINLKYLYCNHNDFQTLDVTGLNNLQILNCNNNALNTLNTSGLINLQSLNFSNNSIVNIDVSGLNSLTNISCFNNFLTFLNAVDLVNLETMFCQNNQLQNLSVIGLSNLVTLNCSNNLLSILDISNLTNLTYLHCNNNQLSNINTVGLSNLERLMCDNNQMTSFDISGLIRLNELYLNNNQLTLLIIKNNYPSWTYLEFDNNPDIQYMCADELDISLVQTKLLNYGYSDTCHVNSYCSFTPGGTFYTIEGNQKIDLDNNGCETNDSVYPNLKFNITNGTITGSLISNPSGSYSIPVQAGTHIVTPQFENPTYFTATPTNTTVTFPATASPFIQDFCIVSNGIHHDLEIVVIPVNAARPGFNATYKIKYKNKGNQTENVSINFNYNDAILDYVSSSVSPNSQATGTLSFNVGTITPFESGEILVTLNINSPTETPAVISGDVLNYTATANGLNTDETPDDNTFTLNQIVVNSFDPNDKTCLEGSVISNTMIGKYVHYKIRFENTGTFAAQNIVVKDMIDTTKFDLATLQMTDASHSCVTRITNPNKVEFIFENINLPFDDANNDGYVVFKIKTKSTLAANSTISNSANIYFDYNFPIVTNTATSTFQTLQNNTFELDNYISLSPNPAKNILNIDFQNLENIKSVEIYNMLGQLVQKIVSPSKSINVSDLKTGNYIIKLNTTTSEITRKFIKE